MADNLKGPYLFYDGRVTLWFDAEKHVYLREDKISNVLVPVAGVTTILKVLDKSDALLPWAARKVIDRAIELIPLDDTPFEINPLTKQITSKELESILRTAQKAPREIKEKAGDTGQLAHTCLEESILNALHGRVTPTQVNEIINWPIDKRSVSCVEAAFDWMQKHHVKWLETERKIYSLKYSYAGTMDGLALVSSCSDKKCCSILCKDVLSLIDWKSSNGTWCEYFYQTAAYEFAYEEEFDAQIPDRWILRLGKEDGKFYPTHLGPQDFEIDMKAFLLCLELGRVHKKAKLRLPAWKRT